MDGFSLLLDCIVGGCLFARKDQVWVHFNTPRISPTSGSEINSGSPRIQSL
jgi:hypothetical protein